MKKMVALALAITMLVSLASVASAKNFDTPVWCNSTTNYTMADSEGDQKLNDTHAAIYVRHYDNVDTTEYTNHFRGIEVNSNYATRGSKWCTQGLNVPIQNNNIQSVTIVRMEVPCCGGLEQAAIKALKNSGKFIPWQVITISTDGKIMN